MKSSFSFISLILYILLFIGYIKCIINFATCDFEKSYKAEIIYGTGVITGLGGILGWFDFGK
jgi:hypothetical protein